MATKSVGGPVLPRTEALAHWHRPGYADYCLVCRRRCEWHTRAAVGLLGDKVLRNRNRCRSFGDVRAKISSDAELPTGTARASEGQKAQSRTWPWALGSLFPRP